MARLLDLAAACDVVVENFRPGVLDRFGAGWAALSAVNPRLVMLSISGFGQDTHEAERAAYAPVIHAEAGLIGRQADITGDPPADIAFALADALAGLHGTVAILAALRLRDRAGTGQHIDLSMLEAMLATDDYTHYSIDEHPVRPARGEVWPAPGGPILISADRRYLWRQLKTCFGVADPDPDARWSRSCAPGPGHGRVVHRPPGPRRPQARPGSGPAGLGGHQARGGRPGRAVGGRARHDRRGHRRRRGEAVGGADALPVQRRRLRAPPRRPGTGKESKRSARGLHRGPRHQRCEAVREVCARFPDEYWADRDESHTFPWEFYEAMAKGGWIGIAIPDEYGGGGAASPRRRSCSRRWPPPARA